MLTVHSPPPLSKGQLASRDNRNAAHPLVIPPEILTRIWKTPGYGQRTVPGFVPNRTEVRRSSSLISGKDCTQHYLLLHSPYRSNTRQIGALDLIYEKGPVTQDTE